MTCRHEDACPDCAVTGGEYVVIRESCPDCGSVRLLRVERSKLEEWQPWQCRKPWLVAP